MHDMVDFSYYRDEYMGDVIPEKLFPGLQKKAAAALSRLCRDYVVSGGEEEKAMAICAMAEEMFRWQGRAGMTGATVGAVKVQYQAMADRELLHKLYRKAAIYLDIYRGRWAV